MSTNSALSLLFVLFLHFFFISGIEINGIYNLWLQQKKGYIHTKCTHNVHTHIDNVGKKINCFSEIMYLIEPKLYKNDYWWNV
jgi:hypothetical protein